jgi:hypothetical protein
MTGKDIKLSIISNRLWHLLQNNNCQFSWLNYVESILNECGLSYVWLNQYFISAVLHKLQILSSLGMFFHRSYSTGSLWLFSLKRQKVNISLSSRIVYYVCILICYLYTIVLMKVTRNKDMYTPIYRNNAIGRKRWLANYIIYFWHVYIMLCFSILCKLIYIYSRLLECRSLPDNTIFNFISRKAIRRL